MSNSLRYLFDALIQRSDGALMSLQDLVMSDSARITAIETSGSLSNYLLSAAGTPVGSYSNLKWTSGKLQLLGAPGLDTFYGLGNSTGTEAGYLTCKNDLSNITLRNTRTGGTVALATPGGGITVNTDGSLTTAKQIIGNVEETSGNSSSFGYIRNFKATASNSDCCLSFLVSGSVLSIGTATQSSVATARGVPVGGAYIKSHVSSLNIETPALLLNGSDLGAAVTANTTAIAANSSGLSTLNNTVTALSSTVSGLNNTLSLYIDTALDRAQATIGNTFPTTNGTDVYFQVYLTAYQWSRLNPGATVTWGSYRSNAFAVGQLFIGAIGDGTSSAQRWVQVNWIANQYNWSAGAASAHNVAITFVINLSTAQALSMLPQ